MSSTVLRNDADPAFESIDVSPLSIYIGAEIGGVDLTRPLPEQQVRDIRAALLKWRVVFFRDQKMDHAQHIAFARNFGELTPGHAVYGSDPKFPEIYSVAKHRTANSHRDQALQRPWTGWHTDVTAAINPPMATILRGDVVPPYGGDTQFTNLVEAYNALSAPMKKFVDELRGIHKNRPQEHVEQPKEYKEKVTGRTLVSEHPLVRVHPETGERALYVGPSHLKSIVGLSPAESRGLLEILWEHIIQPKFTVRFKWEPGSVAFWDNRSLCHLAPQDILESEFERQFWRTTLVGDIPVGVDGRESVSIEGDPILAI